jgi:hypothetical protein
MRPAWILALAASGCRGILGFERVVELDAAELDAATDGAPAACATWRPQDLEPCTLAPRAALVLGDGPYTYDTTASGGTLSDATGEVLRSTLTVTPGNGPAFAVLSVESLTISAGTTLYVNGQKPLVILAWSTITIDGALDASSHRATKFGAGANEGCTTTIGRTGADALAPGSAGGGGGGFQAEGGAAGNGRLVLAGLGGAPTVATLRGGCPGGNSGAAGDGAVAPSTEATTALGGPGGGALRLVAYDTITVGGAGEVSANGGGGAGAPMGSACGGGGGGAGGYLALEAPIVRVDGAVTANGGGGGGGGAPTDAGNDGADGLRDIVAAPGGGISSGGCGQPGGDGSDRTRLAGAEGTSYIEQDCGAGAGGGGGGGAAGFIVVTSPSFIASATSKISPPVGP